MYSTDHRYISTRINVTNNIAKCGGGLSLQASAKLSTLKHDVVHNGEILDANTTIFTANHAHYGGAIHVDDTSSVHVLATRIRKQNASFKCLPSIMMKILI